MNAPLPHTEPLLIDQLTTLDNDRGSLVRKIQYLRVVSEICVKFHQYLPPRGIETFDQFIEYVLRGHMLSHEGQEVVRDFIRNCVPATARRRNIDTYDHRNFPGAAHVQATAEEKTLVQRKRWAI